MKGVGPWLLVVVDGPSEAKDAMSGAEHHGAITKLIRRVFGDECAAKASILYWRHIKSSPLRGQPSLKGYAAKAKQVARLGRTTAYGAIMLVDNDNDTRQDRLHELQRGVAESGEAERTALGAAREMLEAWLLADRELLSNVPLPAGKTCEELWGDKRDPGSNYPKHVLRRCVLDPRSWKLDDAVEAWNPDRARLHAPSLDAFLTQVEELARRQYVH